MSDRTDPKSSTSGVQKNTLAGELEVQLASDRVKRDREWVLLRPEEARLVIALIEAADREVGEFGDLGTGLVAALEATYVS